MITLPSPNEDKEEEEYINARRIQIVCFVIVSFVRFINDNKKYAKGTLFAKTIFYKWCNTYINRKYC